MEGLVSSRTNLVYAYGRNYQYRFLPSSTLQLKKSIYEFRLKTTKQCSPFNVTVASVQPVRGSKRFLNSGETRMPCALMSIAPCAWMKVLMSSPIFVGLERLWWNGLLEQWVVPFLLRMPWLPDYLCSVPLCLKFRIVLSKDPPVKSLGRFGTSPLLRSGHGPRALRALTRDLRDRLPIRSPHRLSRQYSEFIKRIFLPINCFLVALESLLGLIRTSLLQEAEEKQLQCNKSGSWVQNISYDRRRCN